MSEYDANVFQQIVGDYLDLKRLLFEADTKLSNARQERREAIAAHRQAELEYNQAEAAMRLAERLKGKDGALNGPNPETRKDQEVILIAKETARGGKLYAEYVALQSARAKREEAEDDEQNAISYFSAVRYAARMQAGTAGALASQP